MALQDLTPQLRTRLSRMERAVGLFVLVAALLLLFGFIYYVYNTARRKGWFLTKVPYFTFTDRATGLKVGDPVTLMGFEAGRITEIKPMPAEQFEYNVYIEFELKSPNYDYIWTEGSRAKVNTVDLLGKRVLEVTKGTGGYPTYVFSPLRTNVAPGEARGLPEASKWVLGQEVFDAGGTNVVAGALWPLTNVAAQAQIYSNITVLDTRTTNRHATGVWNMKEARYEPVVEGTKPYWLLSDESAAVTERLESLVGAVEKALPDILALTNQLTAVLSNGANLTSNLNEVALQARPALSNLSAATAGLDRPGALGEWLLPTNMHTQVEGALTNVNTTLVSVNTNLNALVANLERSLDNVANLTAGLNNQVQSNSNVLAGISRVIADADDLVQGLKRHWLFRSAFKKKTPAGKTKSAPAPAPQPALSPKEKSRRGL